MSKDCPMCNLQPKTGPLCDYHRGFQDGGDSLSDHIAIIEHERSLAAAVCKLVEAVYDKTEQRPSQLSILKAVRAWRKYEETYRL